MRSVRVAVVKAWAVSPLSAIVIAEDCKGRRDDSQFGKHRGVFIPPIIFPSDEVPGETDQIGLQCETCAECFPQKIQRHRIGVHVRELQEPQRLPAESERHRVMRDLEPPRLDEPRPQPRAGHSAEAAGKEPPAGDGARDEFHEWPKIMCPRTSSMKQKKHRSRPAARGAVCRVRTLPRRRRVFAGCAA